ncbi:MAG TPA: hypothetical protein VGM84_05135 [Steroidobacteraceae bacterium]|jgi:hypothetical protein
MQPDVYANNWSFAYDRLFEPMTEEQAREIHRLKKPASGYAAIFGGSTAPKEMVRVTFGPTSRFYETTWFDTRRRKVLEYQFKVIDERLFLLVIMEFEYDGEAKRAIRTAHFNFDPEGKVGVVKVDRKTDIRESKVVPHDVRNNWEAVPEFGDYDRLLIKDRGPPEPALNS